MANKNVPTAFLTTAEQKRKHKVDMEALIKSPAFHNHFHLIQKHLTLIEDELKFPIYQLKVLPNINTHLADAQKYLKLASTSLRKFSWYGG